MGTIEFDYEETDLDHQLIAYIEERLGEPEEFPYFWGTRDEYKNAYIEYRGHGSTVAGHPWHFSTSAATQSGTWADRVTPGEIDRAIQRVKNWREQNAVQNKS